MKNILVILPLLVLFFGCGSTQNDENKNITFEKKTKTKLVDINGNSYVDKGHYDLLVQAKTSDKKAFAKVNFESAKYIMDEDNRQTDSEETKVKVTYNKRNTSNQILLLLDFSGSLINDCDEIVNYDSDTDANKNNLCYQLVESAKKFVEDVVDEQQSMAIYYFNSKIEITPLVTSTTASTTNDKALLENGLNKLYNKDFRDENLKGYDSTNLYGAVIEATKVACKWVDSCNYDIYKPSPNNNLNNFQFASIVVFTDGRDLAKRVTEKDMTDFIDKHKSIYYYSIGLGDIDANTLKHIGKDKYIPINNNSDLKQAFSDLGGEIRAWGKSFYKIDYCPATQDGNVSIKITLEKDGYKGSITDSVELPMDVDFRCDL